MSALVHAAFLRQLGKRHLCADSLKATFTLTSALCTFLTATFDCLFRHAIQFESWFEFPTPTYHLHIRCLTDVC